MSKSKVRFPIRTATDMSSSRLTVPSADDYPRRGASRKGAFGVACDGARRHPCPRHHDEHSGQDEGTGQEQGRTRYMNGQEVCALHVPYRAVTHGLSRLVTVSRNCCSKALSSPCHVVPKLMINAVPPAGLRSGMVPGLGTMVVGHLGDGIPALAPVVLRRATP